MSNAKITLDQLRALGYDETGNRLRSVAVPEVAKKKRDHPESKLQKNCVKWFRAQYPHYVLFAIPNGGARTAIEAAILIGEGVMPGCADLFLACHRIGQTFDAQDFHGLFIELKDGKKGKQSEKQLIFQKMVEKFGYKYVICRTLDEFMREINGYVNNFF